MLDNSSTIYIELDNEFQAFVITMIVLCFRGYLLVQMRVFTQGIANYDDQILRFPADPGYINALLAGVFLETMFLVSYIKLY